MLARGTRGIPAFVAGCIAGSLTWFTVAATGLAALAGTLSGVLVAIRYLGAAYLLYLAWKLWTAPGRDVASSDTTPDGGVRLFLAGLAINLGNPKAVLFFLALLPTVVDLPMLTLPGFAELAAAIILVIGSVFAAYTFAAARARRLFTKPGAIRLVNRGSSLTMAAAAAAVAAR